MLAIQLDHFARLADARPDERAATREHVDLAGELARPMDGDERLGGAGRPDDLDLAAVTTKNGNEPSPASTSTSPRGSHAVRPCAAMRAICAGVSVGNNWSMRALKVNAAVWRYRSWRCFHQPSVVNAESIPGFIRLSARDKTFSPPTGSATGWIFWNDRTTRVIYGEGHTDYHHASPFELKNFNAKSASNHEGQYDI